MAAAGFCISHCNFFFLLLEVQTALRLKRLHLLSPGKKKRKKKKMELSVTAAMCISWRRGAAEHRGAAAVIRNTLLEAGADSSEQLFLPFTTFMGEFCLPEHFKWRKKYSWSPLVSSCFRSKVDLIVRFLWPGYQWTSQQRPYLMRRLTQRRWTDGSNQTDERFSGVINSTGAALDARPLRFWACVTVNYQTGKSRARGRSKHTSPSTYRTCVCSTYTATSGPLGREYINVKTFCLTQKLTHS